MGYQVIKQPNDMFAIFCSFTDTIVVWDATRAEVVEWFAGSAAKQARENAERIVGLVEQGNSRKAYYQFAKTWGTALLEDREGGGAAWREFTPEPTELGESTPPYPEPTDERGGS